MTTRKSKSYWPTGIRARGFTQTIREIVDSFKNGVYRLNDMQRGDTYTDKQRNDLIASVLQRIPIGEITLMRNSDDADGDFDVLDGGHRLRTLCAFCNGEFAFTNGNRSSAFLRDFDGKVFSDFSKTEMRRFLGTEVSVTKLEPEDVSEDGARRCASAVLAKKMELGVKPTREMLAVVKRGASDPDVGRVLHEVRTVMGSVVVAGYRSAKTEPGAPSLSALQSGAERIVAVTLSSAVYSLSAAKLLCKFSAERFAVALKDGFFGELCGGLHQSGRMRALSTAGETALVAFGCAFTGLSRAEFATRVIYEAAHQPLYSTHGAKNAIRVKTVVCAVKALLLDRSSVRSDILRMAPSYATLTVLAEKIRYMPTIYRSEYKAMREEGVI